MGHSRQKEIKKKKETKKEQRTMNIFIEASVRQEIFSFNRASVNEAQDY